MTYIIVNCCQRPSANPLERDMMVERSEGSRRDTERLRSILGVSQIRGFNAVPKSLIADAKPTCLSREYGPR